MTQTKTCIRCGKEKPATEEYFYKTPKNKDGLMGKCRPCMLQSNKEWKEANQERSYKLQKRWSQEHREQRRESTRRSYRKHVEKRLEAGKRWREKNPDKVRGYDIAWRTKNPERRKEIDRKSYYKNLEKNRERAKIYRKNNLEKLKIKERKYRQENKEKILTNNEIRRSRERKAYAILTNKQWVDIKKHFDNKCAYCGKSGKLVREHFVPLTRGGEFAITNVLPSCSSCNSSKGAKDFFEWYPTFKHYDQKREKEILKFLGYKNGKQQLLLWRESNAKYRV